MDSEQKPKQRSKHPDRVTVSAEALTRLGTWAAEVGERLKGTQITKSDLVNFLILSHALNLSEKELSELSAAHFNEVRFAEWALRQLKEGKVQSLSEIVGLVGQPKQKGGENGSGTTKPAK